MSQPIPFVTPPMSVVVGDFQIQQSIRQGTAINTRLQQTFGSSTSTPKQHTISVWFKKSQNSSSDFFWQGWFNDSNRDYLAISGGDQINLVKITGGVVSFQVTAPLLTRDITGWQHLVVAYDSDQATSTDRVKMYLNGVQLAVTGTFPALLFVTRFSSNVSEQQLLNGRFAGVYDQEFSGHVAEFIAVDGQALTPDKFGAFDTTTGQWNPKRYTGTYGTNGFHLDFANAANLGADVSGRGNNFTVTNFTSSDQSFDSPTQSMCTMLPIDDTNSGTYLKAGLDIAGTTGGTSIRGSHGVSSGKWYWEVSVTSRSAANGVAIGIADNFTPLATNGTRTLMYVSDGNKIDSGSSSAYGTAYGGTDVISVLLDMDAGALTFWLNGTTQGTAFSSLSGEFRPIVQLVNASDHVVMNFGQDAFAHTPPTDHQILSTKALPAPAVLDPRAFYNTVVYSGNSSVQAITGVGFQPDLVWVKDRTVARGHAIFDSTRGAGEGLDSSSSAAEAFLQGVTSFDSDGFTLGASIQANGSTENYVAWCLKKRAGFFDIVGYVGDGVAGRTVAHSLGVKPEMMIIKNRTNAFGWGVYHNGVASDPETDFLELYATTAATDLNTIWNDTAPTSSVFTVGSAANVNENGSDLVAYLFASIEGMSKLGNYTGNGNADGPTIYTGFRPAFVMMKRVDSTGNWVILDAARSPYNDVDDYLWANLTSAESANTTADVDFLSNGFKIRTTATDMNASSGNYVYLALAESPFKYARAR